jgi:mono/diheme cytochrome c family protein
MRTFMLGLAAILLTTQSAAGAAASGNPGAGKELAERWCASCHLVSPEQATATTEAPPFETIASASNGSFGWLEAFLADPHPPMPELSLTRDEIRDLTSYIASLGN